MGRPLGSSAVITMQTLGNLAAAVTMLMIVLTAVFSVFTAVIFLCGSHTGRVKTQKTVRLGGENEKRMIERMKGSLSSKALFMTNMISWRKVRGEEENEEEEDDDDNNNVVWKKTIIKGDKCRPLDFSGKILYDSDGNLLPD